MEDKMKKASNEYAENMMQAMDTIIQDRLNKLSFDRTITGKIISQDEKDDNLYWVSTETMKLQARASDNQKYSKNEEVYVLIPEGNYDNEKVITGSRINNIEKAYNKLRYRSMRENFIEYCCWDMKGIIGSSTQNSLNIYTSTNTESTSEKKWDIIINQQEFGYNPFIEKIAIEFGITCQMKEEIQGDYAIVIEFVDDSSQHYDYTIYSKELAGNPYFQSATMFKHFIILPFNLDITKIRKCQIYLKQFGNFTIDKGRIQLQQTNCKIYFGYDKNFQLENKLILQSGQSLEYKSDDNNLRRDIYLEWKYQNKIYNYNNNILPEGYNIDFFRYNQGHGDASYYGKESNEQGYKNYPINLDLWNWEKVKYKKLEYIENIWVSSDNNMPGFDDKNTYIYIEDLRQYKQFSVGSPQFYQYWKYPDWQQCYWPYGDGFTNTENKTEIVKEKNKFHLIIDLNPKMAKEQYKAIIYKKNSNDNSYDYIEVKGLIFNNLNLKQPAGAVGEGNGLRLELGQGNTGIYNLYGLDGNIMNSSQSTVYNIRAVLTDLTDISEIREVRWNFPRENTMIEKYETEEQLSVAAQLEAQYKIKTQYIPGAMNNRIWCTVVLNSGEIREASLTLQFGESSTSGTNYSLNIDFLDGRNCLYLKTTEDDDADKISIKATLSDQQGREIAIDEELIEWSWLFNEPPIIKDTIAISNNTKTIKEAQYWIDGTAYAKGQQVIYNNRFWENENDSNTNSPEKENSGWKEIASSLTGKEVILSYHTTEFPQYNDIIDYYQQSTVVNKRVGNFYILQARIKNYNLDNKITTDLIAYLPIPLAKKNINSIITNENFEIDHISGATRIVYSSNNKYSCSSDSYELFNKYGQRLSLKEYTEGRLTRYQYWAIISKEKDQTIGVPRIQKYTDASYRMKPASQGPSTPGVIPKICLWAGYSQNLGEKEKLPQAGKPLWVQPILVIQNQWDMEYINRWNGLEFGIDGQTGVILSNLLVAGKKEEGNTFTGVIAGEIQSTETTSYHNTGIYGFKQGVNMFRLTDAGEFHIGNTQNEYISFKDNALRIKTDNLEASLKSININSEGLTLQAGVGVDNPRLILKNTINDSVLFNFSNDSCTIGKWIIANTNLYYPYYKDGSNRTLGGIGLSASVEPDEKPAFWAGYRGASESPHHDNSWQKNTTFYITKTGRAHMKDATIDGFITAKTGSAASWEIYEPVWNETKTEIIGLNTQNLKGSMGLVSVPYTDNTTAFGLTSKDGPLYVSGDGGSVVIQTVPSSTSTTHTSINNSITLNAGGSISFSVTDKKSNTASFDMNIYIGGDGAVDIYGNKIETKYLKIENSNVDDTGLMFSANKRMVFQIKQADSGDIFRIITQTENYSLKSYLSNNLGFALTENLNTYALKTDLNKYALRADTVTTDTKSLKYYYNTTEIETWIKGKNYLTSIPNTISQNLTINGGLTVSSSYMIQGNLKGNVIIGPSSPKSSNSDYYCLPFQFTVGSNYTYQLICDTTTTPYRIIAELV